MFKQMKMLHSAVHSSSGLNDIREEINNENDDKVNEKSTGCDNSTIETSDKRGSQLTDPQAIQKLELQRQVEDMQREIDMLKSQLQNQQTLTENMIETKESSLPDSCDHLQKNEPQPSSIEEPERQVEGTMSQMNLVKAQTENQQPVKQSPGPSNISIEQLQISNISSMATIGEEHLNLNDQSINGIPNKEYNVLLVGQTGVGKSTFINAFANYLTYNSLDEAYNAELVSLIPCHFSLSDDSFTQRDIQFGHDVNEEIKSGAHSSTQCCRAHLFRVHDFVVRLIDTPGIGDTRGIEQDRLNLEEIFTFISRYDELHTICILLKPNEAKLTTTFQFCITQLLCQFHANASRNIVFVFTNSRNTFYRPGDTIAPLKTILNLIKNTPPCIEIPFHRGNTFCLDSEAFIFLIALKHHINFSEGDSDNFCISWTKSAEECSRLIRYVVEGPDGRGLAPHNIQDTTSINEARKAIVDLSRSLAENAKLMQDNPKVLNSKLKEIDECKGDVNKLKCMLYIPTKTLQIKELHQPRTVCTSDGCREMYRVGKIVRYHYPLICHDPCPIKDVPVDFIGTEHLRYCDAMDRQTGICEQCGCHYSKHIHIYYESEVIERPQIDQTIQSQLKEKSDYIKAVENTVKSLNEKVKDYEDAHALLTKFTAKLAVFLQQNALVSRNDAVEEYLKLEIDNQETLNSFGANNADLNHRLNAQLELCKLEKEIFEKVVHGSAPNERITTKDVTEMITQLPEMNIWGDVITEIVPGQRKTKMIEIQRDIAVDVSTKLGRRIALAESDFYSWLQ